MKKSVLEQVVEEQKSYLNDTVGDLERECLSSLPNLQTYALIITGIRRCGKSTLLKQFLSGRMKNSFYLNFEDIRLYEFKIDDFQMLDMLINVSGNKVLFFDEIQIVAGWELFIRQKLEQGFQVVMSGSNAQMLSRELGTKLTGRHIDKELFPFSFREFTTFKGVAADKSSLQQYLTWGGFPEVVKNANVDILPSLITDILNRDIAVRYGVKDVSSLKRLCSYLLSNAGTLITPSKLTTAIGVKSPDTVLSYLSYFEACYLVNIVPRFAYSVKAQMLAPKKLYINDTGLIRAGSVALMSTNGHLLENIVYYHLLKMNVEIYYFNNNNHECDFVAVEKGKCMHAVQVCWELNSDNEAREVAGLVEALNFFKIDEGIVVTANDSDLITLNGKTIHIVPAWKWLSMDAAAK